MACSKLEAMAIYVVKQACGNDIIACVYYPIQLKNCYVLRTSNLTLFFFCNRGDTTYHGTTPDKGVWPSPYTVAGVIISPTRLYYDFCVSP